MDYLNLTEEDYNNKIKKIDNVLKVLTKEKEYMNKLHSLCGSPVYMNNEELEDFEINALKNAYNEKLTTCDAWISNEFKQ